MMMIRGIIAQKNHHNLLDCLPAPTVSINKILSSIMNTSKMMMHAIVLLANMSQPVAAAALNLRSKNSVKDGAKAAELINNLSERKDGHSCIIDKQCASPDCLYKDNNLSERKDG